METIQNINILLPSDYIYYKRKFKKYLQTDKVEYTIKISRLNTVLKYIIKGT